MTTVTAPRRRVGRPPVSAEVRRATAVRTLVTAEEAGALILLAERTGQSVSTTLRLAILALLAADGR